MKAVKCHYCENEITSGRKCLHTGIVFCNKSVCFSEYTLNNSNHWGYM